MAKADTSWLDDLSDVVPVEAAGKKPAATKIDTSWLDAHSDLVAPEKGGAKPGSKSVLEALLRGAGDGATLGLGETMGLLSKDERKAVQLEHPLAFAAGQVVGTLPTLVAGPAGLVARGLGMGSRLATSAATGAVAGGVSGWAHSEPGREREDAIKSALLGAVAPSMLGGVGAVGNAVAHTPIVGHALGAFVDRPINAIARSPHTAGAFGAMVGGANDHSKD